MAIISDFGHWSRRELIEEIIKTQALAVMYNSRCSWLAIMLDCATSGNHNENTESGECESCFCGGEGP